MFSASSHLPVCTLVCLLSYFCHAGRWEAQLRADRPELKVILAAIEQWDHMQTAYLLCGSFLTYNNIYLSINCEDSMSTSKATSRSSPMSAPVCLLFVLKLEQNLGTDPHWLAGKWWEALPSESRILYKMFAIKSQQPFYSSDISFICWKLAVLMCLLAIQRTFVGLIPWEIWPMNLKTGHSGSMNELCC